jgi:hypothetical protein
MFGSDETTWCLYRHSDTARDILDHVLDGAEADRTWQTYTNESREEDEDEMEAELLGR